jgi:hypothetical protein
MISKFRFWDPFNGVMVYSDQCLDLENFFKNYEDTARGGNNPVLMGCSGEKDISGAYIYEGDLYIMPFGTTKGTIVFKEGRYVQKHTFNIWPLDSGGKIVGNVYQNKELINGK